MCRVGASIASPCDECCCLSYKRLVLSITAVSQLTDRPIDLQSINGTFVCVHTSIKLKLLDDLNYLNHMIMWHSLSLSDSTSNCSRPIVACRHITWVAVEFVWHVDTAIKNHTWRKVFCPSSRVVKTQGWQIWMRKMEGRLWSVWFSLVRFEPPWFE